MRERMYKLKVPYSAYPWLGVDVGAIDSVWVFVEKEQGAFKGEMWRIEAAIKALGLTPGNYEVVG